MVLRALRRPCTRARSESRILTLFLAVLDEGGRPGALLEDVSVVVVVVDVVAAAVALVGLLLNSDVVVGVFRSVEVAVDVASVVVVEVVDGFSRRRITFRALVLTTDGAVSESWAAPLPPVGEDADDVLKVVLLTEGNGSVLAVFEVEDVVGDGTDVATISLDAVAGEGEVVAAAAATAAARAAATADGLGAAVETSRMKARLGFTSGLPALASPFFFRCGL